METPRPVTNLKFNSYSVELKCIDEKTVGLAITDPSDMSEYSCENLKLENVNSLALLKGFERSSKEIHI